MRVRKKRTAVMVLVCASIGCCYQYATSATSTKGLGSLPTKANQAAPLVPRPQGVYPPWYDDIRKLDNPFTRREQCNRDLNYQSLAQALADNASPDKVIVLPATVDAGYLGMALNFYEFSLHRLNITNFLFMCINRQACEGLKKYCIPGYVFVEVSQGDTGHGYHDKNFIEKANIKSEIVLHALELGYHVLLTDVDIAYLKNPFHHLPCPECDVQIQTNHPGSGQGPEYNSGFIYFRNTDVSLEAMRNAVAQSRTHPKQYHQSIINNVFKDLQKQKKLTVMVLPGKKWLTGRAYFHGHKQHSDEIVIVHNNWLVGIEAKIYRFKEHLMWVSDQDRYYSDPHRKYITYDNPVTFGELTKQEETLALRTALAISLILNRTLILPKFLHDSKLRACFSSGAFDEAVKDLYRENSFLKNPRTPDLRKSPLIIIQSPVAPSGFIVAGDVQQFKPRDVEAGGASSKELEKWLLPFTDYRVLRFHSLYRAFTSFEKDSVLRGLFDKMWDPLGGKHGCIK